MRQSQRRSAGGVELLSAGTGSLARGLPPSPPRTLYVLGPRGGIRVAPTARFTVIFGRNEPEVHVCVGEGDPRVSRKQGMLRYEGTWWTVQNVGKVPIRFPGSQLLLNGQTEPLPIAYTPLFIRAEAGREHLLEVRITGVPPAPSAARHEQSTRITSTWKLSEGERLVLVVLAQRYLRHEPHPQPLSWSQTADQLGRLQPQGSWTAKRAEYVVGAVRNRLAEGGIRGLTRAEVDEPVGNMLSHNLLLELLLSTTLVPPDLLLIE